MLNPKSINASSIEMVMPRLIAIRLSCELSKAEFADRIGVDRSSYTKMENGDKPILPHIASRIWEQFGVDMNYIYLGRMDGLSKNVSSKLIKALKHQNKIDND